MSIDNETPSVLLDGYPEPQIIDEAGGSTVLHSAGNGQAFDGLFGSPDGHEWAAIVGDFTELPEGIDGADYVEVATALTDYALDNGLVFFGYRNENFAIGAAFVTEDIHRVIIGLRKEGLNVTWEQAKAAYIPFVRWQAPNGGVQMPAPHEVRNLLLPKPPQTEYTVEGLFSHTVKLKGANKAEVIAEYKRDYRLAGMNVESITARVHHV